MTRPPMSVSRLKRPAWRKVNWCWSRTHQAKQGGVHITHRERFSGAAEREFIGLSEGGSGPHVSARHPHDQPEAIVVPAGFVRYHVGIERRPSHLRRPDHQGLFQHSP